MHRLHRPTHDAPARATDGGGPPLLLLLSVAQLMVILDISAVNVALPDLAADLRLSGSGLSWAITSYSVVFGSLLLFGGRAADRLGRRRLFLTGLGIFTAASLVAAMATGSAGLLTARGCQGIGAALLSPAALSILTTTFHGPDRARALAVWGAVGGAGAAVGVLLGGVLTELVDWRAIFLVNLPVGALVAAAAVRVLPADPDRPRWRGLDGRGALLATGALGALVYAVSAAPNAGWASLRTVSLGAAAITGAIAFVVVERRTPEPLLRVGRLRDRAVGGGLLMMLAGSAVLFGAFLLCSLYLQSVLATGPLATGLAFVPFAVAIGAGVHAAGHLVGHAGVRVPLAAGFAVAAAGMGLLSGVDPDGSYVADVLPGMLVAGVGLGLVLVCVSVSVLTGAADDESGMLSGLNTTGHEIGGSLGIAVLATIATGPAGPVVSAGGIGDAFVVAAVLAAVAGALALAVLPSARTFIPKLALAPRVAVH